MALENDNSRLDIKRVKTAHDEADGNEVKLTVEIKNTQPIELLDLTESFLSLGEEYKRFVAANPELGGGAGAKLYIKEIRSGSVVADLVTLAIASQAAFAFMENTNTLVQFSSYLKSSYDFLTGKSREKPQVQKQDLENFSKIVEPVVKDNGSQLNISVSSGGNVINTFIINSTEANAAQNQIMRAIAEFREPETRLHKQVVLYWHRAGRDPSSHVGDRAVIESISPSPVKTVFEDERTKAEMILSDPNPFRSAFIVDVFVETINGRPALYKIVEYHDRLDKPEEESPAT